MRSIGSAANTVTGLVQAQQSQLGLEADKAAAQAFADPNNFNSDGSMNLPKMTRALSQGPGAFKLPQFLQNAGAAATSAAGGQDSELTLAGKIAQAKAYANDSSWNPDNSFNQSGYNSLTRSGPAAFLGPSTQTAAGEAAGSAARGTAAQKGTAAALAQEKALNDPTSLNQDGTLNQLAYNKNLIKYGAAFGGPQQITAGAEASTATSGATGAQLGLNTNQVKTVASQLAPLIADTTKPVQMKDVTSILGQALSAGQITEDQYHNLSNAAWSQKGNLRGWIQQTFAGNVMGAGQADTGATLTSPTGQQTTQTSVQTFLGRTGEATPQTGEGTPATGVTPSTGGAAGAAPGEAATGSTSSIGGQVTGPNATTLPLLQADTKEYTDDLQQSSKLLANNRNLETVLPMVQALQDKDFGPTSKPLSNLTTALRAFGISMPLTNAPNRAEVDKYFTQNVANQPAGVTDLARSMQSVANPSLDIPKEAAIALVKSRLAFDRMEAAIPKVWTVDHPNAPKGYLSSKSDFYNQNDPRGFIWDKMSREDKDAVLKEAASNPSLAAKLNNSFRNAIKAGFLKPEDIKF